MVLSYYMSTIFCILNFYFKTGKLYTLTWKNYLTADRKGDSRHRQNSVNLFLGPMTGLFHVGLTMSFPINFIKTEPLWL